MNVLKERDKRTAYRKECKKIYDAKFDMSSKADTSGPIYRLLDEGFVTYADGSLMMYIAKGTLSKALAAMPEDASGYINYGHHEFATDPLSLIGQWTKDDFVLVNNEDGRNSLDVNVKLFDDNVYVQQLRKLNYTVGLSAEFYADYNEALTEALNDGLGQIGYTGPTVPVVDNIELLTFAVVGECGNVGSSDIMLKGEDMSIKELIEKLSSNPGPETEPEESVEQVSEETTEEETEETVEESVEEDEDITELCEYLVNRITTLESEISTLKEQLSISKNEYKAFVDKVKGLKLSVGNMEKEEITEPAANYVSGDGIGE